jgi:dihydroxyacetone kinase-like protein
MSAMAASPPIDQTGACLSALAALCVALREAEAALNALDRAIGDGDHGHNMTRAATALEALRGELAGLSPAEALRKAGMAVAMGVGGASGPLYGSLLLAMGKSLPDQPALADWAAAFEAGVAAVGQRGRAAEGDKTMLDVLAPAARALSVAVGDGPERAMRAMMEGAVEGFEAARPLRAARGRAAYVGDRSAGADDPGAASALLCIRTVVHSLSEKN